MLEGSRRSLLKVLSNQLEAKSWELLILTRELNCRFQQPQSHLVRQPRHLFRRIPRLKRDPEETTWSDHTACAHVAATTLERADPLILERSERRILLIFKAEDYLPVLQQSTSHPEGS